MTAAVIFKVNSKCLQGNESVKVSFFSFDSFTVSVYFLPLPYIYLFNLSLFVKSVSQFLEVCSVYWENDQILCILKSQRLC